MLPVQVYKEFWHILLIQGQDKQAFFEYTSEQVNLNKQIQRIVVPRSATNLTLKKVKGHRQGHDMVPPKRSCHKEHTCQVSKLYL